MRAPRGTSARFSALLALALAPALLSCGDTRPCKSGTLFVSIDFQGAALAADSVGIDVEPEGESARHSTFPQAAGAAEGSIEIDFPSGYPVGRRVQIVVTAQKSGVPVGSVLGSVTLAAGCSVLSLHAAGGTLDGGSGDGAAEAGHGDGAADVVHGTGGSAGGAGGGSGGGGAGGNPAAGGSNGGSDAGIDTGPTCVFKSAEDCFNGIDDDCNGHVDCDDPGCAASATCVPAAGAMGFVAGVWVDATATCPTRFDAGESDINATLVPGAGCTGCSCVAAISCSANVYKYASQLACSLDNLTLTGGTLAGSVSETLAAGAMTATMTCLASTFTATTNARVGAYVASNGACAPRGTPSLSAPTWSTARKFCSAGSIGAGCSQGYVCVPKAAPNHCVLGLGPKTCPAGYTKDGGSWYTGFSEARRCAACTCGTQTAGSCAGLQVGFYIGTGTTCNAGIHRGGGSNVTVCNFASDCGSASFTGTPTPPTCPAVSTLTGALTATGEQTLCCL